MKISPEILSYSERKSEEENAIDPILLLNEENNHEAVIEQIFANGPIRKDIMIIGKKKDNEDISIITKLRNTEKISVQVTNTRLKTQDASKLKSSNLPRLIQWMDDLLNLMISRI